MSITYQEMQSPFGKKHLALLYVSEDKRVAVLFLYRITNIANAPQYRIRLEGLDREYNYRLDHSDTVISGEQLLNYGINEPLELNWGDFNAKLMKLTAV